MNSFVIFLLLIASAGTYLLLRRHALSRNQETKTGLETRIKQLEHSYDSTVEELGVALDARAGETKGHTKRVTAFTIAIARAMKLSDDQIRVIARGAFLHDVGKMTIPNAILRKSGAHTPDEIALMREHCDSGHKLLRGIPLLNDAAQIVYTHQERFDGTGYPRGLKGEEIPLGARIFAVADTLDANISNHRYRPAQSVASAREEIQRGSGREFDPGIVRIFLSMPDRIWEDLQNKLDPYQA